MTVKKIYIILFSLVLFLGLKGQNLSNFHEKIIIVSSDTISISENSIINKTFEISFIDVSLNIDSSDYWLDFFDAKIFINQKYKGESIKLKFRTYPFKFSNRVFTNDYNLFKVYKDSTGFVINSSVLAEGQKNGSIINFGKLNYDGDFSRGLSFGNGQSLNLNSSFNLQLSGMLTKEIEIKAAITDNSIPIQPDGNTANLQDFDNIYIQLSYKSHYLKVGDFDIKSPKAHFMRFQKSLQGISYWGKQKLNENYTLNAMANISIARGKYALNNLVAEEGNQGPYKLQGANGETFIIVLSGSERVFIDGKLLKRGANEDYTIDYNLGEIRFTPKRIITKNLRIKVEFEYSDRNFFRYLYHLNAGVKNKIWSFDANFYSEQDIKNQSINQDISDDKKSFLENIGDSIQDALYSGVNAVEFSNDRVLYEKLDTLYKGVLYTIYRYSTDSTQQLYALSFSYIGEGMGSYIPSESVANGRVFEWQEPDLAGNMQGSYEPVIVLVTPKQKQLFTASFEVKPTNSTLISTEFALSNQDLNTFSTIDSDDNIGMGIHLGVLDKRYLNKDSTNQFLIAADYEFKQDNFLALERYRNIEFQRNWNTDENIKTNEHLGFIEAKFLNIKKASVAYKFSFFNQDSLYTGFENNVNASFHDKGYDVRADIRYLISESTSRSSDFLRPKFNFSKQFSKLKNWKIGLVAFNELNRISNAKNDSLSNESFWWQDYTAYISSPDSLRSKFEFSYNLRLEHLPNYKSFDKAYLRANTFAVSGNFLAKKHHNLNWNFTYRNLQQDTLLKQNDDLEHFYLARLNYKFTLLKDVFVGNTFYELASGREQKIQYNYIEAPDGQGNYAWQDINENGVQELNEFFVSSFQNDNSYLRLITNSLEFQPVNATTFNQSLSIKPRAAWFTAKGVKKFISRFSNVTSVSLSKKVFATRDIKFFDVINPVSIGVEDTILVSNSNIIRNTLFFNRSNPKYSFDYGYSYNESTRLLTSGFEKRIFYTHTLKARWNVSKSVSVSTQYVNGFKKNNSDFYFDRRYEYILNESLTNFTWLYAKALRVGLSYRYAFRSNPQRVNGGQFAVVNEASTEIKYSKPGDFSVLTNFKYSSVAYNDDIFKNDQLEIDMLQNLQNGNNYIWLVSFDKTIAKNFQLSLIYEGRKTGISAIIHTGRAQVRAVF